MNEMEHEKRRCTTKWLLDRIDPPPLSWHMLSIFSIFQNAIKIEYINILLLCTFLAVYVIGVNLGIFYSIRENCILLVVGIKSVDKQGQC